MYMNGYLELVFCAETDVCNKEKKICPRKQHRLFFFFFLIFLLKNLNEKPTGNTFKINQRRFKFDFYFKVFVNLKTDKNI